MRTLATGSFTSGNLKPAEPDVVHDHIRLRQHQIAAITCISVRIRTRHREHAGQTDVGETVGGSSCSIQLSSGGGSTEMISNRRSDANCEVLVKCIGENLLPSAQSGGHCRPGPSVAAPGTGHCQADLFCHLSPGQTMVTSSRICCVEA